MCREKKQVDGAEQVDIVGCNGIGIIGSEDSGYGV
jgi:hypothetical protein